MQAVLHRDKDEFPAQTPDIKSVDLEGYCESGLGYCLEDGWITCFNHQWIKMPMPDKLNCRKRGRTVIFEV